MTTTTPPTASRRLTANYTAEAIKGFIRDQGLTPGSALPTEVELCAELGVSRSSVREAIRTLASLDIVEVRHGHGTYVGGLSLSPLIDGLVFRGSLNQDGRFQTLREVLQVRIAMDLGVTDELVAAYRGTSNPDLRRLVEGMRERSARGESFAEEDGAFHRQLLRPLGNELHRQLITAFWEIHTNVVPLLGIPRSDSIDETVNAHDEMLDALEAGDPEAYQSAVARHYAPLQHAIDLAVSSRQSRG